MAAPRRRLFGCTLKLVVAISLFWWVRILFYPPDRVEVTIRRVPMGVKHVYLIADDHSGPRRFLWYHSKVFPFTSPPVSPLDDWNWNVPDDQRQGVVQWLRASRYGVLVQRRDGTWAVWWLGADDLDGPSILRYLFGGDRAEIRLPDESKAITPSKGFLDHLGLSELSTRP